MIERVKINRIFDIVKNKEGFDITVSKDHSKEDSKSNQRIVHLKSPPIPTSFFSVAMYVPILENNKRSRDYEYLAKMAEFYTSTAAFGGNAYTIGDNTTIDKFLRQSVSDVLSWYGYLDSIRHRIFNENGKRIRSKKIEETMLLDVELITLQTYRIPGLEANTSTFRSPRDFLTIHNPPTIV